MPLKTDDFFAIKSCQAAYFCCLCNKNVKIYIQYLPHQNSLQTCVVSASEEINASKIFIRACLNVKHTNALVSVSFADP
jgi:hypothetical protein